MSTVLNASDLFRDDVICEEGNTLGILVNVIFNPPIADAYLVVFPGPLTRFNIRKLIDYGLDITVDTIKNTVLPHTEKIEEYIERTLEAGQEIAKEQLVSYLKEIEDKINQSYYLIPISEIDKTSKKEIHLKDPEEEYSDCLNFPPEDTGVCYYNDIVYVDTENIHKITLDKGSIRGQIVTDSEDQQGRITDVILNMETGCLKGFTIRAFGINPGKKTVDIADFCFDTMTCKKPFS